ncbi:MAG: helix-turn-helix domain-containing protein [Bacteroidota bacterium]
MKILEEKKISQVEYAKMIGTSRATISNWSTHKSAVPLDRIIELLHLFPDVDIEWLMTGKERQQRENFPEVVDLEIDRIQSVDDKDYIIQLQREVIILQQRELSWYKQQLAADLKANKVR